MPIAQGTLGTLATNSEPVVFSGKALVREEYAHLNVRRTLRSLSYLPLKHQGDLLGAIEILSFDEVIAVSTLSAFQPMADISASALASGLQYEEERHGALTSITRLTQLYDLEKVFGSTLELDLATAAMCHLAVATPNVAADRFPGDLLGPLYYADHVVFGFDGTTVGRTLTPAQSQGIRLSHTVGPTGTWGGLGGPPPASAIPADMLVDYVRVTTL